jgi:hypothetical protein
MENMSAKRIKAAVSTVRSALDSNVPPADVFQKNLVSLSGALADCVCTNDQDGAARVLNSFALTCIPETVGIICNAISSLLESTFILNSSSCRRALSRLLANIVASTSCDEVLPLKRYVPIVYYLTVHALVADSTAELVSALKLLVPSERTWPFKYHEVSHDDILLAVIECRKDHVASINAVVMAQASVYRPNHNSPSFARVCMFGLAAGMIYSEVGGAISTMISKFAAKEALPGYKAGTDEWYSELQNALQFEINAYKYVRACFPPVPGVKTLPQNMTQFKCRKQRVERGQEWASDDEDDGGKDEDSGYVHVSMSRDSHMYAILSAHMTY